MDVFASGFVALTKAAYESCRAARQHQEVATRVGARLLWILSREADWQQISGRLGPDACLRLHQAIDHIYLCMQAIGEPDQQKWRRFIRIVCQGKNLLTEIEQAEQELNGVIMDFHLEQTNRVYELNKESFELNKKNHELLTKLHGDKPMQEQFELMQGFRSTNDGGGKSLGTRMQENLSRFNEQDNLISVTNNIMRNPVAPLSQPGAIDESIKDIKIDLQQLIFREEDVLGGGGLADVYHGVYNGEFVAIKRLRIDTSMTRRLGMKALQEDARILAEEARLLKQTESHPNIVDIVGCSVDFTGRNRPLIVMELMHTTLFERIHYSEMSDKLTFECLYERLHDIARALEYLHLNGIVYHDVKSLNILLNKDCTVAKLADFGEAKVKGLHSTRENLSALLSTASGRGPLGGTVAYQAPEMFTLNDPVSSRVSEMYSFGVVGWECLTRQIPHQGKREAQITLLVKQQLNPMLPIPVMPKRILEDDRERRSWGRIWTVSNVCLSRGRVVRPSATQVVTAFNHTTEEAFYESKLGKKTMTGSGYCISLRRCRRPQRRSNDNSS